MNYFLLAETEFFRRINEAGDCNMETAYTAFATQVIELCNGGMDMNLTVIALAYIEIELQHHPVRNLSEEKREIAAYVSKALSFVRKMQKFLATPQVPPLISANNATETMHGADRWSGKAAAVFLQPLLLLAAHYLVLFFVFRDAKNRNQSKKVVGLLFWMIPAVSILVSGITYAVALGWKFRLASLLYVGLGLMFAAIGNYFPKCRPNRTVGIRISWTLGSEENWNATHRFAGKVWVIGGLIMVLAALLPEVPGIIVMILAVAALSILPIAYSYRYHRIHGTKSEPDPLSKKISVGMLIFTAVIVVFVAVMLFTGNLHYRFDSDSFTVEASYFDDLTVKYDAIDGIEYREGNVDGTRTYGVGSFRLLLGTFENAEFGTYTRYTYYRPEACVILSVSGKTLVLSGGSAENTRSLYDTLVKKTGL